MDRENSRSGLGGSGFGGSGPTGPTVEVTTAAVGGSGGPGGSGSDGGRSLADEMFVFLSGVQSFEKDDLVAMFQRDLSDQEFGLTLHAVRERLRDELCVEFITRSFERPGFYFRASDDQKLNRGQKFAVTGLRKQMRAVRVLDAVNEDGLTDERRGVLQHAKDKIGMAVMRAAQALGIRRDVPTDCEIPDVPRRGR